MKNIVIIGASSGIGKALAQLESDNGNHVWGTYLKTQPDENNNIHFTQLDILDEEIKLDHLPDVIDGLVYCPGTIDLKPFGRIAPNSFVDDFKLQVEGAVKVIQACTKRMKKSEHASIVLFSTVAVQLGLNFHSKVSASKGAIEGLTRALAAEFAPKVRVNCIAPSLTRTPLADKLLNTEDKVTANAQRHPLKRIGEAEDIARTAAFLLSDQSSWMTGQIIHVDGGMSVIKI